jgi:hypothetical protein
MDQPGRQPGLHSCSYSVLLPLLLLGSSHSWFRPLFVRSWYEPSWLRFTWFLYVWLGQITNSVVPEPDVSSPFSQESVIVSYPFHTTLANLPKIHSHPVFTSALRSSQWFLSFGLSNQNLYTFVVTPTRATYPAHLILLYLICFMLF